LVPADVTPVALTVDADDALLDAICAALPRAMLQLHGQESPERVAEIKARTGRRVIKAIGIAERGDLEKVAAYDRVADQLLFDAKPPPRPDALPGGNAVSFDWTLIKGIKTDKPWMLAGGLGVDNLAQAVADSGARAIDVSSGVEDSPGHKNPDKIRTLLALAATL
ncbi:MAG: phosphoribosylanthranilate isomerase, partial [Alphaproteobacteria bacterium]|nr:phosphoribosylanthranilate isomerase [Alphaproteobacteria bacterium]